MNDPMRKYRAKNENIKIAKFTQLTEEGTAFNIRVCGSRGVFYTINFSTSFGAQCSCIDFQRRRKNCKHIYFVIGMVAKEDTLFSSVSETPSFSSSELVNMCQRIKAQVELLYSANVNIFEDEKKKEKELVIDRDDFCAICQTDLNLDEGLWKCQTCAHVMHKNCLEGWWNVSPEYRDSCAYCRSKNEPPKKRHKSSSGFGENDPWSIFSQ